MVGSQLRNTITTADSANIDQRITSVARPTSVPWFESIRKRVQYNSDSVLQLFGVQLTSGGTDWYGINRQVVVRTSEVRHQSRGGTASMRWASLGRTFCWMVDRCVAVVA